MKVAIIGAGIGGLALACGLRGNGVDVAVYERDGYPSDTGGYHLHLHSRALAALRQLLTPDVLEQLYGSAADGEVDLSSVMRDHRGRQIARIRSSDAGQSLNIDRVTLRRLLAHNVSDAIEWSRTCVGYAITPNGDVDIRFLDGSQVRVDVVVAADGASSAVAQQLSGGRPASSPVGLVGIGGFTPASSLSLSTVDYLGTDRSNFALGPKRSALYIGHHDPVTSPALRVALWEPPATAEPTFIWGAMLDETPQTCSLLGLSGADLRHATLDRLAALGWHPSLTTVVDRAVPTGLAAFRLRAANPRALAPWSAGAVCALGDAVHAVPPTGGQGAATAILDAELLCAELTAASRSDKTVAMAVHDFYAEMRTYAHTVVEESLVPVTWMTRASTPPGRLAMRAAGAIAALAIQHRRCARGRPDRAVRSADRRFRS